MKPCSEWNGSESKGMSWKFLGRYVQMSGFTINFLKVFSQPQKSRTIYPSVRAYSEENSEGRQEESTQIYKTQIIQIVLSQEPRRCYPPFVIEERTETQ